MPLGTGMWKYGIRWLFATHVVLAILLVMWIAPIVRGSFAKKRLDERHITYVYSEPATLAVRAEKTLTCQDVENLAQYCESSGIRNIRVARSTKIEGGIGRLISFKGIGSLMMGNTDIPSGAMAGAFSRSLWDLKIVDCQISKSEVPAIGTLSSLRVLNLSKTNIDDADCRIFATLHNLTDLDLSGTGVSDQAIGSLANCSRLTFLNLSDTELSDVGLAEICDKFPKMETLLISGTSVSDAGLVHLLRLPRLVAVGLPTRCLSEPATENFSKLNEHLREAFTKYSRQYPE